jgi:multiple sugar transport system permease protein
MRMRNTADSGPVAAAVTAPAGLEQPALGKPGAAAGAGEGPPRGTRRWPRARRILIPALFIAPVMVYALVFFAYPLVFGIIMSFQRFDFAAVVHGSGPFVGFANYRTVLSNSVTLLALRNTVVFTVASVVCQVGIGLAVALLLSRKFFLSGFLRRLVLVPWLIPLLATGTIFSLLFGSQNAPVNSLLLHIHLIGAPVSWLIQGNTAITAIILVNIWAGLPFNIIVLYSGLQDIDPTLHEAAMVDGANPLQKLRYITLPLLRPVLLIVVMLGIIATVKVFDIVWVMTAGGPNNATQLLSSWAYTQAFTNFDFGQGAAISNLLLVISFALALIYLRSLRKQGR